MEPACARPQAYTAEEALAKYALNVAMLTDLASTFRLGPLVKLHGISTAVEMFV